MWYTKKLSDLSSIEFYKLTKLRIDTFVVSQRRIYHELDENDEQASHIFYQDEKNNDIVAYARIFLKEDHVTFGRFVVLESYRGQGFANSLIKELLIQKEGEWPMTPLIIEAQLEVIPFYEKHGFEQISKQFIFEGTPHVKMQLNK